MTKGFLAVAKCKGETYVVGPYYLPPDKVQEVLLGTIKRLRLECSEMWIAEVYAYGFTNMTTEWSFP